MTAWALLTALISGCASLTNPVANGIPVALLPEELKAVSKEEAVPILLPALKRSRSAVYRLGPGDVLGIHIDNVLGDPDQPPTVHMSTDDGSPPAVGYPIVVRDDGTVALPVVEPIPVAGLSIAEAEQAVVRAYTVTNKILQLGRERIFVTLLQPRQTRVLVVREISSAAGTLANNAPLRGVLGRLSATPSPTGNGAGFVVDLPAYENDVLTALMQTGGLPGQDEANEVIIHRGRYSGDAIFGGPPLPPDAIVRIPLRMPAGAPVSFSAEDVILQPGDMLLVPAWSEEVFYAAGLLPTGEHPLPRDRDLGVIEAIVRIGGPLVNGGFGGSNLSGSIIPNGIGAPSPTLLAVLRRTPEGKQVMIKVDLNLALTDRRQNLVVQAGDVLILQETPQESTTRYLTSIFSWSIVGDIFTGGSGGAAVGAAGP